LNRVRDKKFSFQDFLNNLQSGIYLRDLDNGFCEQVELSSEESQKLTGIAQFDPGKLRSVRIQEMTSGGFSANTKVKFTPSIPFQLGIASGGGSLVDINVRTMTLYHPCPLRIEGVQPDAVLSLNDPSFDDPNHVVLIPLVGRNDQSPSVSFLQKIVPESVSVSQADPASGQYIGRDISTGANWSLTKMFSIQPTTGNNFDVMNGYYQWKGMPALERVRTNQNNTTTFSWKPSGKASPQYIMLDTPISCSPSDLAILTQRIPMTPPADAIHAVLYSSDPFNRGIVHKQGPPGGPGCAKETFVDLQGAYESSLTTVRAPPESCDSWATWAQTQTRELRIFDILFGFLVFFAMCAGAYLALTAVLRMYDVEASQVSKQLGKLTAVVFKNIQNKAKDITGKLQALNALRTPGGIAGLATGAALGGPAALANVATATVKKQAAEQLENVKEKAAEQLENVKEKAAEQLEDTKEAAAASVTASIANVREQGTEKARLALGDVKEKAAASVHDAEKRITHTIDDAKEKAIQKVDEEIGKKKKTWDTVDTSGYLGKNSKGETGKNFLKRGGKTRRA
jgi:hypothetical protein